MGVLENINIHDGSGNTLTSTASALDINLKTSAATVTVAQANGNNLHTVVDSGIVRTQDGVGNNLTSTGNALDSNLKTIGAYAVQTGTGASGSGVPRVTVANDSKIQPWDGINSAKYDATGETTVDITRFGGSPVLIGQTNMAHSIPVVIASDQQISVAEVYNNQTGTVTSGVVPNALNGTLALVNDDFVWSTMVLNFVLPLGEVLSLGGTFQVEGSVDGNTWTALTGTLLSDTPEQITQYSTTGFGTCSSRYNLAGFPWLRLRTTQPFTGTINVQQALTTAQGDEVGFTTARIVDDSGNSVDLTPAARYTEGQSPQAIFFQGGQTNLAGFPEGSNTNGAALPADAVYVLPRRSQIGNTLVIAVVIQGTSLTAANLAPMWLEDTAGSVYTLAQMYDSTVTSAGQAIALYVRTITAVDNEGQVGLMLGFNGTIGTGQPITSITGINILVHEYSGVVVSGVSFAHVVTAALAGEVSAPVAPSAGYLTYSLVSSQYNEYLSMNRLSTGPYTGAAPYPVESCTGDNVVQFYGINTPWDWVNIKLPIATTGQVMMGRLIGGNGDGPIQAIKIDPDGGLLTHIANNDVTSPLFVDVTNPVAITTGNAPFVVQIQDSGADPISSTGGALNVNVTNASFPVTQAGTWTVTADNGSSGPPGGSPPAKTTVVGGIKNGTAIEFLQLDANNNLMVNVAAGNANPAASATGSAVPADASYTGLNIGGNLVGQTGLSLTNAKAAAVAIVDANGNQITDIASTQYENGGLNGSSVTGTVAMGLSPAAATTALSVDSSGNLNTKIVNTPSITVSGTPTVSISGTPTVISKTQDGAGNNLTSTGGSLNVNVTGGSASGTQYAAGTAVATPTGTVALGTDGTDVRALSTTSTGALNVATSTGSLNVNVTAPVAITGANGASVEAGQSAAAPAHVLQVGGQYNSTAPNISSGDITALQTDGNGSLKVSIAGQSATPLVQIQSSGTNLTNTGGALNVNVTNGAAAATGSAVPAEASYTGFNSGGNLVGVSSTNPLPVSVIGAGSGGGGTQYETGQLSGAATTGTVAMGTYGSGASTYAMPLSVSSTGVLHVDGSGVTQPVSGTVSANIESNGTAITNTGGALDINIKSGAATQYAAGTAVATPTGTMAMGTDGSDVRALSTTSTGVLNVNVASASNSLTVAQSSAANLKATVLNQDGSGNALTSTSGALDVNLKSSGTTVPVSISGTPAVTVSGTPTVSISGTPAVTVSGTVISKAQDGSGNALTSTGGSLNVNITGGGAASTQYAAGAAVATPTGTVALGTDGTDVRALKTDATGRLNVIIAGSSVTQAVQIQAGSTPVSADANGALNVNVTGGSVLNSAFINGDGSANPLYPLACTLYGLSLTNLTSAPVYVEFFDTGSPSLGSSTVVFCIVIPANGNVTIPPTTTGLKHFSTGLGFGAVTAENGTTTAAVTGMIFYK